MRTPALLFTLALFVSTAVAAKTATPDEAACDTKWEELSDQYARQKSPPDHQGLLDAWKAQKQCANSARYKARLALTYFFLDQPKEAEATLRTVKESSPREPLVELVQIIVDVTLPPPAGESFEKHFRQVEQRLIAYATDHPTDIAGIGLLADVLSENRRYDSAIELYRRALTATGTVPRAAGLMRNLSVTLAHAQRYAESYDVAGQALALDPNLMSDLYFICAAGRTQAALGKFDDAKNALTLLAAKRPAVLEDPEFKSAVAFIKEKIAAAR